MHLCRCVTQREWGGGGRGGRVGGWGHQRGFYYEQQIKWEIKRIHTSGCRCNERLKVKTDGSKCLSYTKWYLLLSENSRSKGKTYIWVSVWWKTKSNFYYEQKVNRELKWLHISGYRYNERLTAKTDGSKHLSYTGLCGDLKAKVEGSTILPSFFLFIINR